MGRSRCESALGLTRTDEELRGCSLTHRKMNGPSLISLLYGINHPSLIISVDHIEMIPKCAHVAPPATPPMSRDTGDGYRVGSIGTREKKTHFQVPYVHIPPL